jgi:hypothetical protein
LCWEKVTKKVFDDIKPPEEPLSIEELEGCEEEESLTETEETLKTKKKRVLIDKNDTLISSKQKEEGNSEKINNPAIKLTTKGRQPVTEESK